MMYALSSSMIFNRDPNIHQRKEFHCCAGNPKTMSSMLTRAISRTFTLGSMTDGSSSTLQVRTFTHASMADSSSSTLQARSLTFRLHDKWFQLQPSGKNLYRCLHYRCDGSRSTLQVRTFTVAPISDGSSSTLQMRNFTLGFMTDGSGAPFR
jgi:hypothetical protein